MYELYTCNKWEKTNWTDLKKYFFGLLFSSAKIKQGIRPGGSGGLLDSFQIHAIMHQGNSQVVRQFF